MEAKEMNKRLTDDQERGVLVDCSNENCDLVIPKAWKFCPECGKPTEAQEDTPLILKSSIAYLALYELDPYEFKLFMYIYFEAQAIGLEWKRIKQEDLEKECGISHPKVLKSIGILKATNGDPVRTVEEVAEEKERLETLSPEERAEGTLHWIAAELRAEHWTKRLGYGLHPDLDDYERLAELLKPYREVKRRRIRNW